MTETMTTTIEAQHAMVCQYVHPTPDGPRFEVYNVTVRVVVCCEDGEDSPSSVRELLVGALESYGTLVEGTRNLGDTNGAALARRLCTDLVALDLDVRQIRWADGPAFAVIERTPPTS